VIWVSTTGSDGSGNGSETAPYASLKKAMDVAREYTIVGKAILYIRLKRGEYTINENLDLYHPQGGNLIIEGDPSALKQRVIWQVEGYSWNMDSWGGGGHTATIRLWDGATTNAAGHTLHGFSADEFGMYFSVTNAQISSRGGYRTSTTPGRGILSETDAAYVHSYGSYFNGDRFFNRGASYEDAQGILGIGRVHAATASGATLAVQFNNLNYDCRAAGWMLNGGLNNTVAWGGVPSNFPETQYAQPNGYYGSSTWVAEPDTTAYPSNPGVSNNTVDPFVLTTYPVVIRAEYTTAGGTLFLKNGRLLAIRNLFFAPRQTPYMGVDNYSLSTHGLGITYNSTMSIASAASAAYLTSSGTGIVLENADVGIRHLGFLGVDHPIVMSGSRLRTYYENTVDPLNSGSGSNATYSAVGNSGSLDNTPILNIERSRIGINAADSSVDFVDSSGNSREYNKNQRMEGVYISSAVRGVQLSNSTLNATAMFIQMTSDVAVTDVNLILPMFDGNLSTSGGSAAFQAYSNSPWNAYPLAKVYMTTPGNGEQEIGVVGRYTKTIATAADISGITSGSSVVGHASGPSNTPNGLVQWDIVAFKMIRVAPQGLCFWTLNDWRNAVTAGVGGTLGVRFFNDMQASGVSSSISIGKGFIGIQTANGTTQGFSGIATTNPIGSSAAAAIRSVGSYGSHYTSNTGSYTTNSILAIENSRVKILKSLWIHNGGHDAVDIRKNSTLMVGDTQSLVNGAAEDAYSNIIATPDDTRYTNGVVAVTGYAQTAIRVTENSSAVIGSVFVKHPMHSSGIGAPNFSNDTGTVISQGQNAIRVQDNSSMKVGNMVCVGRMGGNTIRNTPSTGLWTTWSETKIANRPTPVDIFDRDAFVLVDRGSNFILRRDRVAGTLAGSVFALDGGAGSTLGLNFATAPSASPEILVFKVGSGSNAVIEGVNAKSDTSTQSNTGVGVRFALDTRTGDRKIMTRSSGTSPNSTFYASQESLASNKVWNGDLSGVGYISMGLNIGTEGSSSHTWNDANSGVTLHAYARSERDGSITTG